MGEVQVAVDAAELLASLGHPSGAPAQCHLSVLPVIDVAEVGAGDRDHRLDAVGAAQGAGQLVSDVSELVQLAATDTGWSKTRCTAGPQRLRTVDATRICWVVFRPRFRSPTSNSVTVVVFSVEPSTRASGCKVVSISMLSATARLTEVHAVDHQRDEVQLTERGDEQLGKRGLGRRDESS